MVGALTDAKQEYMYRYGEPPDALLVGVSTLSVLRRVWAEQQEIFPVDRKYISAKFILCGVAVVCYPELPPRHAVLTGAHGCVVVKHSEEIYQEERNQ